MTKSFFVVIPYAPTIIAGKRGNPEENFQENASQLAQRVEVVEGGLTRCGIRIVELGTEELIELYYKSFNPGVLEKPIHLTK